jgi:hypothetical protein
MCHFSGGHSNADAARPVLFVAPLATRSDVRPSLRAADDRNDPRQEHAKNRHDHAQSDLFRLQSCSLPFQENGKGQPPDGGYLGIEFATQVGDHTVVAEQVPHQAAERAGKDSGDRTPQPERPGRRVQHNHDADDSEGGKRDGVECLDRSGAKTSV